jgi:NAD(P)-dependent dehydrogenase (short-subunit alcohol dehydrogenase family)
MVMWNGSHAIDRRRRAGHSRLCRNRPRGCAICFVTSIAGRTGLVGEAVYSATKACLDAFAESLLGETARSGVTISVVVPGVVDTGFFETRGSPYARTRPRPIPADTVVRAVEGGPAEEWRPRWLRSAPTVRALAPGAFRRLAIRFSGSDGL